MHRPNTARLSIPVFIGGKGPYQFLLDTGSSHTVISQTLATILSAVPVAKAPIATSVGSILALVVRLPDVAVGSARVESLLATSLPPDASGMLDDGLSGLLGQDFLSQFDYTLDYRASRLSWHDEGQVENGVRLVLEPSNGRFLVQLPQDERCRCPVRLVPDSGANGVVLFAGTEADRLASRCRHHLHALVNAHWRGTARSVIVRALLVGRATLWDLPAAESSFQRARQRTVTGCCRCRCSPACRFTITRVTWSCSQGDLDLSFEILSDDLRVSRALFSGLWACCVLRGQRRCFMKNRDELEGKSEALKGKAKQAWGDFTDDERLRNEGLEDEAVGDTQETLGRGRRKVGEAIEDLGKDIKR